MKTWWVVGLLGILVACGRKDDAAPEAAAQNISVLIKPNQTDAGYNAADESHYVVRNTKNHQGKLLLFIGGSFSMPRDYNTVCDHGATIGLDVISLSYPNSVGTAPLGANPDPMVFDNYRDELCYGNPVSNAVSVDDLNCIVTRAVRLVSYLKNNYPDQGWEQYLTATGTLRWEKMILAGHSQGSGHACYLGKRNLVDRVVMFSGPNDYHAYYNRPGTWLTVNGLTPLSKQYALLHVQDEIVPFNNQVANLRGLGMLTSAESPTAADNLAAPYAGARTFSVAFPAISNHASTIGRNSLLPGLWSYLFGS